MSARDGRLIKVDILATDFDAGTGEIRVNIGDKASGVGSTSFAPLWAPDGFISRPVDSDGNGACIGLMHEDGNIRRIIATKDNRNIAAYGMMGPGDRAIVSKGKARWLLKDANASIVSFTQTPAGDTCIVSLEGQTGTFTVAVGGPQGSAMFQMKSGEVTLGNGAGAAIHMKGNAITLHADTVWVAGGRTCIGVLPGGLAPLPGINAAVVGPSGMMGIASSTCTIAP